MTARVEMNAGDYDTTRLKKFYAIQGLLKSASAEDIYNMPQSLQRILSIQLSHFLEALTSEQERRAILEMNRQKRERARETFVRECYEAINGSTVIEK